MVGKKVTFSVIKADVGSYPGHMTVPKILLDDCKSSLEAAVNT